MEVECPHCKTKGRIKWNVYAKNWDIVNITAIIPYMEDGQFSLRYFEIHIEYDNLYSNKTVKISELLRETFKKNNTFEARDRQSAESNWMYCNLPVNNDYYINGLFNRPIGTHASILSQEVYVYTRNINQYLHKYNKELKYVDFNKLLGNKKLNSRYDLWDMIMTSSSNWKLVYEYLQKLQMDNLAIQLKYYDVDLNKKSLKDILRISKEQYNELCKKKQNADINLLRKYQVMHKYKKIRNDEEYKIYKKYIKGSWKAGDFLKSYKPTLYKLGKYAKNQKEFSLDTYYDYLKTCEKLELDMKNDFVLFPDNLDKAHQMTTDMWNELQFDIKLNKYAEKANEYSSDYDKVVEKIGDKFNFETDKYQIVVPQNTREIGHEGYKLRHCVAQYINKVIDGQIIILFLRDKEQLDTPLYTMSIVNDTIDECKGYRNCKRPPEIEQFVEKFAKAKHLILNQNEHFAAIM